MATWVETNDSRAATIHRKGKKAESSLTKTWRVFGAADDATVHSEADSKLSGERFVQIGDYHLMVESYTVAYLGDDAWEVQATYTKSGADDDNPLRRSRSFDTSGATTHITQARGGKVGNTTTTQSERLYPPNEGVSMHYAIGVDGDSVAGVDIITPQLTWSESYDVPGAYVTAAYIKAVAELTGTVNKASFRTFAAGEVLFLGATGSQEWDSEKGDGPWNLSYKFSASSNVTEMNVGDITGITKKGHEYLWILYEAEVNAPKAVLLKKPKIVYVNNVYLDGDFSALGLGGV